jgi:predicted RNase H-like HicB family nuclease
MRYPVAIEAGDARHAYGFVVPELPGCFSTGDTLDEALMNAQEAVPLHLEGLFDDGKPLPKASHITWAIAHSASEFATREPLRIKLKRTLGVALKNSLSVFVTRARRARRHVLRSSAVCQRQYRNGLPRALINVTAQDPST